MRSEPRVVIRRAFGPRGGVVEVILVGGPLIYISAAVKTLCPTPPIVSVIVEGLEVAREGFGEARLGK